MRKPEILKILQNYSLLVIVTGLVIASSCKSDVKTGQQPVQKKAPLVKIQPAVKTKMVSFIEITGTIQANVFTEIKSPVDGIIQMLAARENQRTQKDKIIAIINPNDRVSLIANTQLQISQIEQKMSAADKNSTAYQSLEKELEEAKSNLEYAYNMYQTIPIICPMNGVVTQRWLDEGSQVSAKEKILTISNMNSLVIKAEVNEKYFAAIKQGKKLPLVLNAYPEDSINGTISLVYPQVDPVTRSVKFDIKIVGFNKNLLPGMMASIKIPVSVKESVIAVPEQSVLTSPDNKSFVFVVNSDSVSFKRIVTTGIVSGNKLEIIKGINENEKVVVQGQEMLKDSLKVKIMKEKK